MSPRILTAVWLILIILLVITPVSGEELSENYYRGNELLEYYYRGQWEEASALGQEILKQGLSDWQLHADLATLYYDQYRYMEALPEYHQLISLFPDNLYFREKLATAYFYLGQWQEAEDQYREILNQKNDYAPAWFGLGRVYQLQVRQEEALTAYQKAAELDSRYVEAYVRQGEIYEGMGEWEKAVQAYQKVLKIDASCIFLHLRLASIFEKMEDYERALARYEKWLSIFPEDEEVRIRKKEVASHILEIVEQQKREREERREALQNITVLPVVLTSPVPEVRVSLGDTDWVGFKCGSDFTILELGSEKILLEGKSHQIWEIFFRGEEWIIKNKFEEQEEKFYQPLIIIPRQPTATIALFEISYGRGYFWAGFQNRQYRGKMMIVPRGKNRLRIINIVNLEEYLYSVVPGEILPYWPMESLKAQAVAARTIAVANLGRHQREGYDFCAGVHCAVYSGVIVESPATNRAVNETSGEILVREGKIISAIFSSNCGGHTQGVDEAWGSKDSFPSGILDGKEISENWSFPLRPYQLDQWITGKPEVFCNSRLAGPNNFRWRITFKKSELEKIIRRRFDIGELITIFPGARSQAGFVQKVMIVGTNGVFEVKNDFVRSSLGGLKSNLFKIEVRLEEGKISEYTFIGGGWGHGVGMCQTGAGKMALRGYKYQEILAHYYPGALVTQE